MCLYVEPIFTFVFIEHKEPLHNHIIDILHRHIAKCPRGGVVIAALRYKPEGRGIDSRLCHWNFLLT
jgi:hypothetical protein